MKVEETFEGRIEEINGNDVLAKIISDEYPDAFLEYRFNKNEFENVRDPNHIEEGIMFTLLIGSDENGKPIKKLTIDYLDEKQKQ